MSLRHIWKRYWLGHPIISWNIRYRGLVKCSQCNTNVGQWPMSVQSIHASCSITSYIIAIHAVDTPCLHDQLATYLLPQVGFQVGFQVDTFYCNYQGVTLGRLIFFLLMCRHNKGFYFLDVAGIKSPFPLPSLDHTPDLLITLNFTGMGLDTGTMSNSYGNSVQIMIGLTNDTHTVVERTVSTTILPGVNLVGVITWDLRQLLKSPRLSAFASLFEVSIMLVLDFCLSLTTAPFFPSLMKLLLCHGCSVYILILWPQKALSFSRVTISPPSVWLWQRISLNQGCCRITEAGLFYKDSPKLEVYGPS